VFKGCVVPLNECVERLSREFGEWIEGGRFTLGEVRTRNATEDPEIRRGVGRLE
jgi:hypothetical protein